MDVPRRAIVVWITEDAFLELLGGWDQHLKTGCHVVLPTLWRARWAHDGALLEIPRDVKIDRGTFSWERRAFGVLLTHESFPPVEPGDMCPEAVLTGLTFYAFKAQQPEPDGPILVEMP